MTDTSLIRFERSLALHLLGCAASLIVIFWASCAGFALENVANACTPLADVLSRAFPPHFDPIAPVRVGWKLVEMLLIAVGGAMIGVILSRPGAFWGARGLTNGRWTSQIPRTVLRLFRPAPNSRGRSFLSSRSVLNRPRQFWPSSSGSKRSVAGRA